MYRLKRGINEVWNKCLEGKSISRTETVLLLKSENTHSILQTAKSIRDRFNLARLPYSPKVFINLINLCRDTCSYCTYKKEPTDDSLSMMSRDQVLSIAQSGKMTRCMRALIVAGERPEEDIEKAEKSLKCLGNS